DARKTGQQLLEQLQSLALLFGHLHGHPGDVAARTRKPGNNTGADWIAGGHHDRYGVGGSMRGKTGRCAPGHDQVDRKTDQLGGQGRKSLGVPLRKTIHEEMSLPFDIAEVAQPVPQSLQRWPGLIRENADFPKVARRLRSDGSWPPRRAAERGQEFSSSDVACHVTLRLGVIHAMRDDTTLPSRGLWLRPIGKTSENLRMTAWVQ